MTPGFSFLDSDSWQFMATGSQPGLWADTLNPQEEQTSTLGKSQNFLLERDDS